MKSDNSNYNRNLFIEFSSHTPYANFLDLLVYLLLLINFHNYYLYNPCTFQGIITHSPSFSLGNNVFSLSSW